jgi:hypothetical protein
MARSAKYDYRDIDRNELRLIRAGHYLWNYAKRSRNSLTVSEREALSLALQTIWDAKRELRAELKVKRAIEGAAFAQRVRNKD